MRNRKVFDTPDGTLTWERLGVLCLIGLGLWAVLLVPLIWWAKS